MADIVTYRRIRNDNSESTILSFLAEHNGLPYSLTSYLVQTNAALVEAYWLLLFNKTLQVHRYLKHAQLRMSDTKYYEDTTYTWFFFQNTCVFFQNTYTPKRRLLLIV